MKQPAFIEDRHEVKLKRRIADIRPWTEKAAESLTDRFMFSLATLPVLVMALLVPVASFLLLPVAATLIITHRSTKPLVPMRYPKANAEPDPATGKPGSGIMLFGHQESRSPYERFKEIWGSDDDLRKHMLILGSTGSGKSETLKALFFNALCWSSGFFIADGKADNKLPTDVFTMVRSVGMDDNLLTLNFLLAGSTPEQVRRSRRRRTNKLNPFTSADADTIIQMGANMLPKVEGEGKNWQEKALNLWRALVIALCYKRDTQGFDLSVSTLVEYMSLTKIEELYIEGFDEAQANGEWSYGFISIKTYLDSGCPAYKVDKLLTKHGRDGTPQPAAGGFGAARGGKGGNTEQDSMAYEQHAYRTSQLMPVLNLLDKTYGHIFRDKYPEIDMVDVTLNNRIMTMLIPSLEKSAQEAENLGKLAIACLRVMMARNLGGGVEGTRQELLESKATNAPFPYLVALDELGYYFSDGIAVIFAQARSLGFSMIPAAQDLEKLTEGNRAAEAGAMMANSVTKIFLRIDDAKKTYEFVQGVVQKAKVAVYRNFEYGGMGWKRKSGEVDIEEIDRVSMQQLQGMEPGQGLINALGKTTWFRSYYMDSDLKAHRAEEFWVLRFLQVRPPSEEEVIAHSMAPDVLHDPVVKGERLRSLLIYEQDIPEPAAALTKEPVIEAIREAAARLPAHVPADVRAIALFEAAREALRTRGVGVEQEGQSLGFDVAQPRSPGRGADDGAPAAMDPARGLGGASHSFDVDDLMGTAPMRTPATPSRGGGAASFDEVPDAPVGRGGGLGRATPGGGAGAPGVPPAQPRPGPVQDFDIGDPGLPQDSRPEGIDLDALFDPKPPFERKALEQMRDADAQAEPVVPLSAGHLVDPVSEFLAGVRYFNMPRLAEPAPGQTYSASVEHLLAQPPVAPPQAPAEVLDPAMVPGAGVANVVEDLSFLDLPLPGQALPARPPAPAPAARNDDFPALSQEDEDWIAAAVQSSMRPARPDESGVPPERTAVGFAEPTIKALAEIESLLGSSQPQKAVQSLENIMSAQITPPLRPEVPADNETVDQIMDDLASLGSLGEE